MVSMSELQSWEPGALTSVADALSRRKRALEDLQNEMTSGKPPASWRDNDNSGPANAKYGRLHDALNDLAAEVARVMGALDVASTEIKAAKEELIHWQHTAKGQSYHVTEQGGSVSVEPPKDSNTSMVVQTGPSPQQVADGIGDALKKANEADAELTRAMTAADHGNVDGGSGSIAAAESKGLGGVMSVQEQINYCKNYKLKPGDIAMISPQAQKALADQAANSIHSYNHPGEYQHPTMSPETVRIMQNLQGGQAFAHELFAKESPHEMAQAIEGLNAETGPGGNTPDSIYKGFLDASGTALATYTKATDAYAPPGGVDKLEHEWFGAITSSSNPQDGAALSLMIKSGGHETSFNQPFIRNLTGDVYEWERHQPAGVWGSRDPHGMGVTGLTDPNTGVSASDGLANLLGGMEHSPQAAQDFFQGNYPGSTQDLTQRMDYLVGGPNGRTWDAGDFSDDGQGLGRALQAACVGEAHRTVAGTQIADHLFANIAKYGGQPNTLHGFNDKWHVGPNMTDNLGVIASGYKDDLYKLMSHQTAGNPVVSPHRLSDHLSINEQQLNTVLAEIGNSHSKAGLETLATSMQIECRQHNLAFLQGWQGPHTLAAITNDDGYTGLQGTNQDVMAHLVNQGSKLWSDTDHAAAERAAVISKAVDVASNFVPGGGAVMPTAHELTQSAYDAGTSQAIDQIHKAVTAPPSTSAVSYVQHAEATLPNQMQNNAISDLYRTGFLGPQHTNEGHFGGISPLMFTGHPPSLRDGIVDEKPLDYSGLNAQQRRELDAAIPRVEQENNSYVWSHLRDATSADHLRVALGLPGAAND